MGNSERTGRGGRGLPAVLQVQDPQAWGGMKRKLFACLRSGYLLGAGFVSHQGALRAAALTYVTALSLVPLLAIAFSVLKGLGVQNALEPLLHQVAGDSHETIARIIGYVNNTNVRSLGVIGLLALVLTVISLLGNVEEAFNAIWEVRETRPLRRRFSDYLSVVVVGPILLLAATSMTSSLESQWLVQWLIHRTYLADAVLLLFKLAPYVMIWVVMVCLYLFIPNTRVRFRSALLGGVLAGTAWQVAQWGYFHFQVGVAKYNAIYGTLAALPIFLVWVYTSWLIVLFGLEVVCAHQRRGHALGFLAPQSLDAASDEELSLAALMAIGRHFRHGGTPPGTVRLADELGVPQDLTERLLKNLTDLGYVVPTAGGEAGWLPAREQAEVPVCEVLASLRGIPESDAASPPALAVPRKVIRRGWDGTRASLAGLTLHDLLADDARNGTPSGSDEAEGV